MAVLSCLAHCHMVTQQVSFCVIHGSLELSSRHTCLFVVSVSVFHKVGGLL